MRSIESQACNTYSPAVHAGPLQLGWVHLVQQTLCGRPPWATSTHRNATHFALSPWPPASCCLVLLLPRKCVLLQSPDCYTSSVGSLNVHHSSGPANHFYYLLAEGSAPASPMPASPTCDGSVVVGIGRAKAEKIWYCALTTYMVSSTNYAGTVR